jgi:hypothetical protein
LFFLIIKIKNGMERQFNSFKMLEEDYERRTPTDILDNVEARLKGNIEAMRLGSNMTELYIPKLAQMFATFIGGGRTPTVGSQRLKRRASSNQTPDQTNDYNRRSR